MIVMCAWCEQEGRPAGLGERAPLDDQSKTHGICRRHAIELLNRLPSRSFPGVRLLLVVSHANASTTPSTSPTSKGTPRWPRIATAYEPKDMKAAWQSEI